ncbi:nitrogen fixation NifU-like protein [Endobacter medicaginis]|uniref:Iron-sulfur cluster assembly scaffold protein n=1 Tax=Endobacter medicaginis TaxID=1181271 RepID=A0A839V4L5_9PROT|nr:iron-sulfur cluster assembly scaffold protein [Endobacter medicaginis]MBB3174482.1 nitrogen fixation NifU-like protein [Endobacter medicaginis]MCX5475069.1 iron-sulfur cluster assembly scaffold protein [Endobacter medicaginis]NVN29601.1 iron-sulfur cluster assembly scaffold protein [Endobacter medicaginis]
MSTDATTLYQDWVLARARAPLHAGRIAGGVTGVAENRSCGDSVRFWLKRQDGRVVAARHETEGCAICQASADLIAGLAAGLNEDRLATLWEEACGVLESGVAPAGRQGDAGMLLGVFAGVAEYRARHRCAMLPYQAYEQAARAG